METQNTGLPKLRLIARDHNGKGTPLPMEVGRFGHNALFSIQSRMFKDPETEFVAIYRVTEKGDGK